MLGLRRFGGGFGHDLNHAHHAAVFVFEKMAVVEKRADDLGIAKIHAELDAGKLRAGAVPVRDIDGVAQEGLVERDAVPFLEHEMDLMDMEGVQFARAIFDDPVLDIALGDDDAGSSVIRIE